MFSNRSNRTNAERAAGRVLSAMVALALAGGAVTEAAAAPVAQTQGQTSPTGHEVGMHFEQYYKSHDGLRLLGYAVSDESLLPDNGSSQPRANIPVQYFQKGRIEYQGNMGLTGQWEYTYGLLVPEMIAMATRTGDIGISNTSITYMQLRTLADPSQRVQPPAGFRGGTQKLAGSQSVFIPQSPTLGAAPGYLVPPYFWDYMNSGVFPTGWLHDLGLPVSTPFQATAMKNGVERGISMQAFERGILTYDPQNPAPFKVERANVGADYVFMTTGSVPGQGTPNGYPTAQPQPTPGPVQAAATVVTAYWRAIDEGNYPAAYELLTGSYKAGLTLAQFSGQTAGAIAHATGVQVKDSRQLPDGTMQLTVQVNIVPGAQPSNYNSGTNVRFFTLAQESGVWRITGISTSP